MVINDVPANRKELDLMEQAVLSDERKALLDRLGSKAQGLRCWAFGLGWETRSVEDISTSRLREFAKVYASM